MNTIVLERNQNDVFYQGKKLTIVKQETKGTGKEVVKIESLPGSNGQKWISLSKLQQGTNEILCQGKDVTTVSKYKLTEEESKEVKELQARIDIIISNAKSRYVAKPNLDVDPSKMTEAQRLAKLEELKKFYNL